jgi:TolB-like protein
VSFSSSSSGRGAARGAVLALALLATGCGGASRATVPDAPTATAYRPRIALFPPQNLSGRPARAKELEQALEKALRSRGIDVVAGDAVRRALAAQRIRYTGGLDRASARAVRDGTGADAVLIPSIQLDDPAYPPRLALDARLVTAGDPPLIVWEDGVARGGSDSPGFLNLSLTRTMDVLQGQVLNQLADSLASFLQGNGPARPACGDIKPRVAHRAKGLDKPTVKTVAVLPFTNQTERRNAGDAVELEIVRQLVATGKFRVVEPGTVRAEMLAGRVTLAGGVSLDAANLMGSALGADVLVGGAVRDYQDPPAQAGPPQVEVGVQAIDARTGDVLWWSSSRSRGDDGVVLFGLGRVSTATELACGVARGIAERMAGGRGTTPPPPLPSRATPSPTPADGAGTGTPPKGISP